MAIIVLPIQAGDKMRPWTRKSLALLALPAMIADRQRRICNKNQMMIKENEYNHRRANLQKAACGGATDQLAVARPAPRLRNPAVRSLPSRHITTRAAPLARDALHQKRGGNHVARHHEGRC
ncbi:MULTISPECIES: hypothetical protein [unclassified Paracoccus (in: a-proteobacteria)]|uniref:hypothetical protein n=1 Tax=unclassified Paracoccus (in: a-proteobacteria) TaxID=2688777 RepID=UPI0012B3989A|nr:MULTISPECIES: hypothetical protein [unclassified Paracoccus (in: a-proteobacteria)]UXU76544.1 hypothetical protein GB879_014310 [Paracoccus sp. SMMA_5]UXU82389.1 hypothetical protein GB880_014125 [Paracoccus sp. SMMA_5_TC]